MSDGQIGGQAVSETQPEVRPEAGPGTGDTGRILFDRALHRRIKGLDYLPSLAPPKATSARDSLIASGTLNLFRYRPQAERAHRVPVLLVMATGSPGYVADLVPGNSLVEHLLKAGFDLFMAEWSPPKADDNYLKIENYVLDFLPRCVSRVRKETGEETLTMIGYRSGGTLALLWAALNAGAGFDRGARNLVCIATPFDHSKLALFQAWADRHFFDVDKLVDRFGCCPTDVIDSLFEIMAGQRPAGGEAGLWDGMWRSGEARALNMFTRWMGDILPQAGEYFRQIVKRLLWENRLMRGALEVGGRPIEPSLIGASFLQVIAENDMLVPPDASRPLIDAIGSKDKSEIMLKGGHAGLFLGREAREAFWPSLAAWLAERSS